MRSQLQIQMVTYTPPPNSYFDHVQAISPTGEMHENSPDSYTWKNPGDFIYLMERQIGRWTDRVNPANSFLPILYHHNYVHTAAFFKRTIFCALAAFSQTRLSNKTISQTYYLYDYATSHYVIGEYFSRKK